MAGVQSATPLFQKRPARNAEYKAVSPTGSLRPQWSRSKERKLRERETARNLYRAQIDSLCNAEGIRVLARSRVFRHPFPEAKEIHTGL